MNLLGYLNRLGGTPAYIGRNSQGFSRLGQTDPSKRSRRSRSKKTNQNQASIYCPPNTFWDEKRRVCAGTVEAPNMGPNYLNLQQADFMRSSGAVASRTTAIPEGWNEEAYLKANPDVMKAVDEGVMPSGLWHYLKYGKKEGRGLSGWGRRPGFLAGIGSPWRNRT